MKSITMTSTSPRVEQPFNYAHLYTSDAPVLKTLPTVGEAVSFEVADVRAANITVNDARNAITLAPGFLYVLEGLESDFSEKRDFPYIAIARTLRFYNTETEAYFGTAGSTYTDVMLGQAPNYAGPLPAIAHIAPDVKTTVELRYVTLESTTQVYSQEIGSHIIVKSYHNNVRP